MPFAALQQQWQEDEVGPHRGEQVRVEDALPLRQGDVERQALGDHADVVHHDVDPAEVAERALADGAEIVVPAHVARHADRLDAGGPCLGGDGIGARRVHVGRDDCGARARERECGGASDAASRAGDHRDATFEVLHGGASSPW